MKCCSFNRKDLEKHFNQMSQCFYTINGMDDVNLKHLFLNSLPEPLGNETLKVMNVQRIPFQATSLGEIYQNLLIALDKLCNQRKFLVEIEKTNHKLGDGCNRKDLQIKCKDKDCSCSTRKENYHQHFPSKLAPHSFKNTRKKQKWRFLRKRHFQGKTSNKCFICYKPDKVVRLLEQTSLYAEEFSLSDLESLYSLDEDYSLEAFIALGYTPSASDNEEYDDTLNIQTLLPTEPLEILPSHPTPIAQVQIVPEPYTRPISVIALFDTGASATIMNPKVLSPHFWLPHHQIFRAANGKTFLIDKIKILSLALIFFVRFPISVGHSKGLSYKQYLLTWSQTPTLFPLSPSDSIKSLFIQDCCANNHSEFLTKNPHPLWTNPEFFIHLPFKKNEDVNPTKASHRGMNPSHLELAKAELTTLLKQNLIEPTTSPWACEAFYVNKYSKQVAGKLRLVINYQDLNQFLADDKFLLPNKASLFRHLSNAKVFSKLDLKAGFWQLGIHPEDRPNTAFCIPDHHYQWTVMLFSLKTAPSHFQKVMINLFKPLLANALIYIDDILLFSKDHDSHALLLSKFYQLVKTHGIMLSEKKMFISQDKIDFLGMTIFDGKYTLQPHIAQALASFPDILTSTKIIQQFLGIVNYIADFIPKVAIHRNSLSQLLKKNPPPWNTSHTVAVQTLKMLNIKSSMLMWVRVLELARLTSEKRRIPKPGNA
ncbi:hypothetical protein L1049_016175 [Liquidambar formosana]|uniref:Reverse transcriptase domain-containing protein n=1 Tax=Liquidambar formosana TaxID=63359 RepID=A0AAP0S5Z9_LIQFO